MLLELHITGSYTTLHLFQSMEDMGNSRARAVYEANLPDNYKRPSSSDSAMEQFIRAKYEHKKYIAREWVPPKPRSAPVSGSGNFIPPSNKQQIPFLQS